ncbi:MAG TPA: hypothetical protein VFJ58_09625 [Armatimonadota bacterium]|nr:hypothetical protein [Armatimonadota bacterium]
MPRIVEEHAYNGVIAKISRLGAGGLLVELREILTGWDLRLFEVKNANGGAVVREKIDQRFAQAGGWTKATSGDIDWQKCKIVNGTRICVGVEIQVSARSDLIVMDVIHLRKAIVDGMIDFGVMVVPSAAMSVFLIDRAPSISDAKRHVLAARADDLPLLVLALEHDGPAPEALPKRRRKVIE